MCFSYEFVMLAVIQTEIVRRRSAASHGSVCSLKNFTMRAGARGGN